MKKLKAFTLVELLVVVVIIGILATLVVVGLRGASIKAKEARAKNSVSSVQKALSLFLSDSGTIPSAVVTACGAGNFGAVNLTCRAAINANGGTATLSSDPVDGQGTFAQVKLTTSSYTVAAKSAETATSCWWATEADGNLSTAIATNPGTVANSKCY